MIYSVDVQITTPVKDTEVPERVEDAIENLFPEAEMTRSPGELLARSHGMEHFSELLHEQAILDTARGAFFGGQEGDTFAFDLKKQAAFEGRVNFAVGNPGELGTIHVRVKVTDPSVEQYVDHVAPPTEDGKPIERED
jgi:predicted RNA binding protein with dsRBD fold (UPF0201 family)